MTSSKQHSDTAIVTLEQVTHHYGDVCALDDITLNIPARQMVGLIGPDGVGKSTLISLIAGARKVQQGNVIVLGGDIREEEHRRAVCPRIAYMPQGLGKNLYHTLSVFENVDFSGGCSASQRKNVVCGLTIFSPAPGSPVPRPPGGKTLGG